MQKQLLLIDYDLIKIIPIFINFCLCFIHTRFFQPQKRNTMRKEISINAQGGQVFTNVKIVGLFLAGYYLQIFESNSNNVIADYSGHNEFDNDDWRALPNSAQMNIGRVLMLDTTIVPIDEEIEDKRYLLSLEIYQDGALIDAATEEGPLTLEHIDSLILVKLI